MHAAVPCHDDEAAEERTGGLVLVAERLDACWLICRQGHVFYHLKKGRRVFNILRPGSAAESVIPIGLKRSALGAVCLPVRAGRRPSPPTRRHSPGGIR